MESIINFMLGLLDGTADNIHQEWGRDIHKNRMRVRYRSRKERELYVRILKGLLR